MEADAAGREPDEVVEPDAAAGRLVALDPCRATAVRAGRVGAAVQHAGVVDHAALRDHSAGGADQPDPVLPLRDHDPPALARGGRDRTPVAGTGLPAALGVQLVPGPRVEPTGLLQPLPRLEAVHRGAGPGVELAVRGTGLTAQAVEPLLGLDHPALGGVGRCGRDLGGGDEAERGQQRDEPGQTHHAPILGLAGPAAKAAPFVYGEAPRFGPRGGVRVADRAETEDLWRLMLQHSPIGMAVVDPTGRLLMANRALCEMLGYSQAELLQRGFQDLTHPEDLDADLALFHQVLAGELDSYRIRKRYLHAEGHVVWGDLSVAVVRDPDGTARHFISQVLDVTEQRANEERLEAVTAEVERERQMLAAIFDTVNVGLLLIGPDGRYERTNKRHADTLRRPFPEGHEGEAGQLGHVYFPDGKTLMSREQMPSYRAAQGEEFDDYNYWVGADPATWSAFSTSARQVRGPSGERLGAVLAYQEVTDLMRAIQVKDEFVASVSHELRTPLTSVLGHLELLGERDDLTDEVAAQLRVVQRNAARLQALLSDLLLIGQIADGTLELNSGPVDLRTVVDEAVEAVRAVADQSDVSIRVEAPGTLPAVADGQRLRQVLDNLLSNAIKYGRAGCSVTVELRRADDGVELLVADTGMGIADHDREHVFGRFFRGGEAVRQHLPGTGLGLSIVASIVAAHGGTVTVESELGRGSTFRVALPGVAVQH
ncbi:PAS/PAC sensor signal transduction histidine kinase [Nocardioides sp. JS614]|nr:PAS/PAC sensor signal transduction histidine kinase [Nocardioides sp. JS614]